MPLGREVGLGPSDIALDGDQAPPPENGGRVPTIFGPCLLWANGWMDQDSTWHGGGPQSISPKKGTAPNFRPMSVVAKRLDGLRYAT